MCPFEDIETVVEAKEWFRGEDGKLTALDSFAFKLRAKAVSAIKGRVGYHAAWNDLILDPAAKKRTL